MSCRTFDPDAADGYGHGHLLPPLSVCGSLKSCPHLVSGGVAQAIRARAYGSTVTRFTP